MERQGVSGCQALELVALWDYGKGYGWLRETRMVWGRQGVWQNKSRVGGDLGEDGGWDELWIQGLL